MACGRISFLVLCVFCAFLTVNGHKKVIKLNEDNWTDMLEGQWMVEFFAPWCPACKGLQKVWLDFSSWSEEYGMKVAQVDVTTSPGLSGRFMVTALPTIFHVINGEFRQYKGSRDLESFQSFMETDKWKAVEAIPSWKSPQSIQMSVVSSFFKLSQVLRHFHNRLMEDYGLPSWGSYIIFAVATIMLGALLGLILVCFIDMIYPPRSSTKMPHIKDKNKKTEKDSDDELELDDDDIQDDLLDDASQSDGEKDKGDSPVKANTKSNPSSPRVKKRPVRKDM